MKIFSYSVKLGFLVLILLCVKCNVTTTKVTTINLTGIDLKSPVKIVLSEFKLDAAGERNWVKVDSITTSERIVNWPQKYDHSFIADLTIYSEKKVVVGLAPDFIFSNYDVSIKKNPDPKLFNYIFKAEGGENKLYENKEFLALPNFKTPVGFYDKIKDSDKVTFTDDPVFAGKWSAHENDVLSAVKSYPANYYTVFTLMQRRGEISNFTLNRCYNALTDKAKVTAEGKFIKNYLLNSAKLYNGNKIHSFNVADKEGKQVEFKKLLSKKYYFIDFWASWCTPCREKMKQLKQIYPTVDTNKLQFVSLSVDIKKDRWLTALKQDDLKWVNYIEADKKANNLLLLFNLDYIPQNILITGDGAIVNRNLSIIDLNKFIIDKGVAVNKQLAGHDYITAVK